jgi:hypothetical protein
MNGSEDCPLKDRQEINKRGAEMRSAHLIR